MDDEMILARGGTQEDIDDYAKRNGADLTREDFMIEEILKEFEKTFPSISELIENKGYTGCKLEIIKFISIKLTAFEKNTKEEFLKRIKLEIDNLPLYGTLQESGNEWAWKRKDIELILTNANKEGINI